jgi:TnpA family transposase
VSAWEESAHNRDTYCQQVGIDSDPARFVSALQTQLTNKICATDLAFPTNTTLTIKGGEPVVRRLKKQPEPVGLAKIDQLLNERMPECNIVDILTDTQHWLNWTDAFGPLSGFESRLASPQQRYVTTTFCYGCYLGPTQTSRSIAGLDRFQVAYVNQRHITEQNLLNANVEVINRYNHFILPKLWGSGKRAAADGTKWDVYEQNLLSEYHIRYVRCAHRRLRLTEKPRLGWNRLLPYLRHLHCPVQQFHCPDRSGLRNLRRLGSNLYPSFGRESRGFPKGRGDNGLLENRSDIRPDTLHADTQGQSETVFGLAYLLAIQLMPRIRNFKHLTFYAPSEHFANEQIQHIHELFSDTIDWRLIQTRLPDMLRVAISISQGKVRSSTILRKLGTESRKNKLYVAFRELGRAIRTLFLLDFISDEQLRRTINASTNTVETWNGFVQWVAFGGEGVIRQNDREEQRKIIRYNHLVANLVVFHNVVSMTRGLQELIDEGIAVTPEIISRLSPYKTEHINRFGTYELRFDRVPQPITEELILSPTLTTSEL